MLDICIDNFGPPPRAISAWDRLTYLRLPKPLWLWLNSNDDLMTLFQNARTLLEEGVVVWGHVIQANQLMFSPGRMSCPGEVVYSIQDPVEPEYLTQVARQLFSLKGTSPTDPSLAPISKYLTDEMIRVFGLPVPESISPSIRCRISTTFFVRKHLPKRRLCASLLPLIVNPQDPFVALPLPARYWPRRLVAWWTQ